MAQNNKVTLTGNMGAEARIIETEGNPFASFSLATKDSYKDKEGNWQEKDTVWHDVLVFNPKVVEEVKNLKKGTRIEIKGALSYRKIEVPTKEGTITKQTAAIIANDLELSPLVKKFEPSANSGPETPQP